jgi:predicted dehydrogenase
MRVAVIGAGLIGRERIQAIQKLVSENLPVQLAGIYDSNIELCQRTAQEFKTKAFAKTEDLLQDAPDWVVVALPHDIAVPVAHDALQRGLSVLMEKPMGRDLTEARKLFDAGGDRLKIGFNYRYFPGIRRALQDAQAGRFGKLIAIELLLGHGGSPGQQTWKLNEIRAGGGCLIDPGVHLLDLCLLLGGKNIEYSGGNAWSGFWKTGIEEDVQLLLRTRDGVSISAQISITRWRSTFSLTLHGTEGYGIVSGRNRSYGRQTYRTGPRWGWRSAPNQAASETEILTSDGMDTFTDEVRAVLFPATSGQDRWPCPATATEALIVMEFLDSIREHLGLRRNFAQLQEKYGSAAH